MPVDMITQPSAKGFFQARKIRHSPYPPVQGLSKRVKAVEEGKSWAVAQSTTEAISTDGSRRNRFVGTSRRSPITLPELEIKSSLVPCGGLGVFAKERILKNTWLTEYGGEIIDVQEAKRRRSRGEDTHIRSAGYQDFCIDSRVRGEWSMQYYIDHHMTGGFFNDAKGTGLPYNCAYVTKDSAGYQHPYTGGPWVSKRVFLRCTRDVEPGEELLIYYGPTYHNIHFA